MARDELAARVRRMSADAALRFVIYRVGNAPSVKPVTKTTVKTLVMRAGANACYELPATGSLAKVVVDPELPESCYAPFRRAGQREELEGVWNGRPQIFCLPSNPHAASFFLTREQMGYWIRQPTFGDSDASWIGPLESAATFSVGRVFDIYKPLRSDPGFR